MPEPLDTNFTKLPFLQISKVLIKPLILVLALLTLPSCFSIFMTDPNDYFVTVEKGKFFIDDKPYYFAGTNLWYGMYLGMSDNNSGRQRLIRELDRLDALGIKNLRILGSSELSYMQNSLTPVLQCAPFSYNEELLVGLDFLLNEMKKRGMRAVIILNNFWEWSGGMVQYNTWFGGTPVYPDSSENGWADFMNYAGSFYTNQKANQYFRHFFKTLAERENSINGIRYKDDPVIMSWQLANEPRAGNNDETGLANLPAFRVWMEETSAYIKSIDTNHLVSSGSEGIIGCLKSAENFLFLHRIPTIDYLTFHLWPANWAWLDKKDIPGTFDSALQKSLNYVKVHIDLADSLKKPLVLEEFGLQRDSSSFSVSATVHYRDRFYESLLASFYHSASGLGPVAGFNFWAWGGEGRNRQPDYKWKPGLDFMGDPPHEPQGYYSVFDTDSTTISILKNFADKFSALDTLRITK